MATIIAAATGNWSSTGTWTGAVVPVAGDIVFLNNKTVTVDVSAAAASISNLADAGSGAAAGGTMTLSPGVTLTANLVAGASNLLTWSGGGTVAIVGNLTGGTAASIKAVTASSGSGTMTVTGNLTGGSGSSNATALSHSGACTVNIIGNVTGGAIVQNAGLEFSHAAGTTNVTGTVTAGAAGSGALGIAANGNGTLVVTGDLVAGAGHAITAASGGPITINGNITGGTANGIYGLNSTGSSAITINGNTKGGSGSSSNGVYASAGSNITINGTSTAGTGGNSHGAYNFSTGTMKVTRAKGNEFGIGSVGLGLSYGVFGSQTGSTRVAEIEWGTKGACPVAGNVFVTDVTSNVAIMYRTDNTAKTLVDDATTADYPAESDVRLGVLYNTSNRTGSCAVPAAGSVALGVPVDATTGTAVLTEVNVRDSVGLASANLDVALSVLETLATDSWDRIEHLPLYDAGTSGGLLIAGTNSLTTFGALEIIGAFTVNGTVADFSRLDAPVSSRMATFSYTAPDNTSITAIKAKTDQLTFTISGQVDANALTGGGGSTAADVWDLPDGIETGVTPRKALRAQLAALAGKLSGAATNEVKIRDAGPSGDTKDRITATVDPSGNRTAVTLDLD